MTFTVGLKRICEICFYFAFANLIGLIFGGTSLFWTLPLFVLTAFLTAFLSDKGKVQYIPLVLLVGVFFPLNIANGLVLLPACVYLIYATYKNSRGYDIFQHFEYITMLKWFVGVFLIVAFIAFAFGFRVPFESSSLPFGIIFLISVVSLLRMLRHDMQVLNSRRFTLANILYVAGISFAVIALSSEWSIHFLRMVYVYVIVPTFALIVMILGYLMLPILHLLTFLVNRFAADEEIILNTLVIGPPEKIVGELGNYSDFELPMFIFYLAAGAIAVFLLVKIIKRLQGKFIPQTAFEGVAETRFSIGGAVKSPNEKRSGNKIREVYKQFLNLCRKKGIDIQPHMTSLDVENAAVARGWDTAELRDIYIKVRYCDAGFSRLDLQRVKALLRHLP